MKTPKEWFEEELSGEPLTQESVIEVLEMIQKETWNEAIDKAAESAEIEERDYKKSPLKTTNLGQEISSEYEGVYYGIDKQSILKLKL